MKVFLLKLTLFLFPLFAGIAYTVFALWYFDEFMPFETFISIHETGEPYVFGKGYVPFFQEPKEIFLKTAQPDIVVLGNSRSLQVRQDFFDPNYSFFNYGMVGQLSDLESYLAKITNEEIQAPQVAILIVDPRWFLGDLPTDAQLASDGIGTIDIVPVLTKASKDVLRGKILPKSFFADADIRYVGTRAAVNHAGLRNDGSYSYGDVVPNFEHPDHEDHDFKYSLRLLERNLNYLRQGASPEPREIAYLATFFQKARGFDIHVVTIFSPYAPTLYEQMTEGTYEFSYIKKSSAQAKLLSETYGHSFYDFSDPKTLALTNKDFIDGVHWSEVANALAFMRIAESDPAIARILNDEMLTAHLRRREPGDRYLFK